MKRLKHNDYCSLLYYFDAIQGEMRQVKYSEVGISWLDIKQRAPRVWLEAFPPPSLASSHHRDDEQHPATLEMLFNRTFCLLHDVGT